MHCVKRLLKLSLIALIALQLNGCLATAAAAGAAAGVYYEKNK